MIGGIHDSWIRYPEITKVSPQRRPKKPSQLPRLSLVSLVWSKSETKLLSWIQRTRVVECCRIPTIPVPILAYIHECGWRLGQPRNGWLKYIEVLGNKSLVLVVLSPIFEPTCCNSAYTICLDLDTGSWWFMNPLSRIIYKNGQPWKWTVAILRLNSSSRVVPTFRGYVHSDRRVALEKNR